MSDKIREAFDAWISSVDKRRDANGWEPLTARDVHMLREGYMEAALAQQPALGVPQERSLDARLEAAGMLTVVQLMQGQPIDAFIKHAGIHDLATFSEWLDLKCMEFLSMKAQRELEKQEDDELYEWVFAHAAVFHEVRVNFKAAKAAPAAPVAQEPVGTMTVFSEGSCKLIDFDGAKAAFSLPDGDHQLYVAPPAAGQPGTVAVPRELLERAMYAKDGRELVEANRELRALLAGGAE